jgi:hypothetical protein
VYKKKSIQLYSRKYYNVDVFICADYNNKEQKDNYKNVLYKLIDLKKDDGKPFFRESADNGFYVPIKMTQDHRPNMTTPEFKYYIDPWIRKIVDDNYYEWKRSDRSMFKDKVNDLRKIVNEIDRAGDLSKYNCDAIREGINNLENFYDTTYPFSRRVMR